MHLALEQNVIKICSDVLFSLLFHSAFRAVVVFRFWGWGLFLALYHPIALYETSKLDKQHGFQAVDVLIGVRNAK